MLTEKMEQALNDQINKEIYSSYLYYSMSAYFSSISLDGFAHWMEIQAQEELFHVKQLFDYINERRGRVRFEKIDKPDSEWESPLAAFEAAFKHENFVSRSINELVYTATTEKDNATYNMLQWFVNEQVEEEASVDQIVQKLKLIDGFGPGLFMVDQELATRVLVPPTTA